MMDVEGRPRVPHAVQSYIDYSKDKQGLTQVTLVSSTNIVFVSDRNPNVNFAMVRPASECHLG